MAQPTNIVPPNNLWGSPPVNLSQDNLLKNHRIVYYCRIFVSTLAGCAAGILGFQGWAGLFVYLLITALTALFLLFKIKFKVQDFFQAPSTLVMEGVFQGLFTYVMFWALGFNLVHTFA
eukprot:TRINITY_DN319_c0_g1_i3.p1 TRINITY_DN319_c0_g1~~TRINITY_DN319_c0_g1_i3.p1  ORF type:complete len:119 (+),score=9.37 TRINITY_DN319_c0_g1_i3:68-424(+)